MHVFFVYVTELQGGPILSVFELVLFPVPLQVIVSAPAGVTCPDTAHMGSVDSVCRGVHRAPFAHVGREYEADGCSGSQGSPGCLDDPCGPAAPRVGGLEFGRYEASNMGGDLPGEKACLLLYSLCCWTLLKYTPRRAPRKSTFTSLEDASEKQAAFRLNSPSVTAPDETTA